MDYEFEGVYPRDRPKRTWKEVFESDVRNLKLKRHFGLQKMEKTDQRCWRGHYSDNLFNHFLF